MSSDRPDLENDFAVAPKVTNRDHATFSSSPGDGIPARTS